MLKIELLQKVNKLRINARANTVFHNRLQYASYNYVEHLERAKFWKSKEVQYLKIILNTRESAVAKTALGAKIIKENFDRMQEIQVKL